MTVAGGLLGAIVGSFIATIVMRWPQGRSAVAGRSACDGCGAPLPPIRLIPVASYVAQRGRTACCDAPVDRIHLLTEIAAAIIGAASVAVSVNVFSALAGAIFGWLLLALALLDARHFWLPDKLTFVLAATGLAAGVAGLAPSFADRLIGGAVGFLLFAGVAWGYRLLRHRDGMGGGDVKLFGAIGLWLGWRILPFALLGAALVGLVWSLVQIGRGRRLTGSSSVPFGTCLAIAAWIGWISAEAALF
ncbi:peptidase A24 [Sphingomonas sp. Root710]|nr:peptidase A24 [Sphingomonas sp. Root710]